MIEYDIWVAETCLGRRMIAAYKEREKEANAVFRRTVLLHSDVANATGGKMIKCVIRADSIESAIQLCKRQLRGEWYKKSGHMFDVVGT